VELGVHLPLVEFSQEGLSLRRLQVVVDVARECGFSAVTANDHFLFARPWLDGLTALAAVIERSGEMTLATTISLAALRGPVPLAKTLVALDVLSGGRLVAGVGPGSSKLDYDAVGVPFEDRWARFDEAVMILRGLLRGERPAVHRRYFAFPDAPLAPAPQRRDVLPVWIGSWGSAAGLRRVARLGDGWLASAYNTTPDQFATARERLSVELVREGKDPADFPNALTTMWTWVTESRSDAERVLTNVVGPLVRRDPAELRGRVCVGSAAECAQLLSRYAAAGCQRVHFWPLGDEEGQIELLAREVGPQISASAAA
jgi:alkanesulfonate monooxygenase SsuD/methylene tetrahydromethanopterin reductase-like flavin-dependent oxidoreductase (luciferase family)